MTAIFFSCKKKKKDKVENDDEKKAIVFMDTTQNTQTSKTIKSHSTELQETNKMDSIQVNTFHFEKFKPYQITDTIRIDLNGNGIIERVFFDKSDCAKILIKEEGQKLISIGCENQSALDYPKNVGWVNEWCAVSDEKVWEVLFTEDGDIDKDTIVHLERPSIYIGKRESGGGIITYRNDQLYWVHQSD